MAQSNVFESDGTLNPAWLQQITNEDALVSEIAAYFIPGKNLKPDVKCCIAECVMIKKNSKPATPVTPSVPEYNPMLFCFFCNRVFHAGCLDLDQHLIKVEKVPWKCNECKLDYMNEACQSYFQQSSYAVKMLERRKKFLLSSIEETEESLCQDLEFSKADLASFERRATQILFEEDPEVKEFPNLITPYLLKRVMQTRADKKRAAEISERFKAELEETQAKLRETIMRSNHTQIPSLNTTINDPSTSFSVPPSSSSTQIPLSTVLNDPSNRARNVLSNLYIGGNTTASIEAHNQNPVPSAHGHSAESTANVPATENADQVGSENAQNTNNSQGSVNNTDFTVLLQRLTVSQERDERRNLENIRRRALPKIAEFKGEENKWLAFKQDVDRYREHLGQDEIALKYHIKGALKGEAFEIVRDLFDAESLDVIMSTLKIAYGDEMRMVRNRGEELKNFKFNSNLYRMDAIKLQAAIQSYFAACRYANIGYVNTNVIAEAIFCQFNLEDRLRCKDFYVQKNPNAATIVMDVQTIYEYLLKRIPLLDDTPIKKKVQESDQKAKSKPYQVHNMSMTNSTHKDKSDFKFDIKDKSTAQYIGYDLDKVATIPKECKFCSSTDHYAVQCPKYKDKNENERMKWIADKGLCKNCVITTAHQASECDMKTSCGYKVDKTSRCCSKHHISIHEAANRIQQSNRNNSFKKKRTNTKNNTARATERVNNARNQNHDSNNSANQTSANTGAAFKLAYKVNVGAVTDSVSVDESPKTVKVFRVKLWGPAGYVVALVIGDSGSEITLMREDLREALGLKGSPHTLHLQWADKTTRTSNAVQLDMQIQSLEDKAAKIDLNNCFALEDLFLPQRTLDMNKLREQFPYLKNIPFEGYFDEYPVMLLGAPHAHLIEGCELVEGGDNGPIAVRTRIGWSVYGGMTHLGNSAALSQEVNSLTEVADVTEDPIEDPVSDKETVSNDTLHKLLIQHFSVESLGIRATQTHLTEDEKNAMELLDEEIKVLEGGFIEAPLVWKRKNKIIPRLPNNYAAVYRRQLAEERKLMKNPLHLEVYNNNMKELIALNFIREATSEDMNGNWPNIWYLPTSLVINTNKNPPKMRNVYDASAKYQGTSLNENLLKGPDLLINIINPLIRMRMNSIAFTADVKAMFNMVKICARDQQCQRLLFRENVDSPMKTFIATVMLFGPTSSPFTSQYVKNMTAEKWMDRYPDAAKTLINYTYMDDVLTSEPTIEKALQVATQCIEICDSMNWKLIAFQSNSPELLNKLPPSAVKQESIPFPGSEADSYVTKVLGCQWNTVKDCFQFKLENNLFIRLVKDFDQKPSKRDQASTLARIYDVLGLISHFTIRGKILLQRSWENKLGWDDTISDKAVKDWKNWLSQINDIAKLEFPRKFTQIDALNDAEEIHLHIFSDAGNEAYGTVAYIVIKSNDLVESSIVMAKAKVTPLRLKTETAVKEMPRLELMGALLAARLGKTITDAINNDRLRKSFWCDSEVVLRWILNPNQKLIKYAIGPIEEILELTERKEWNFVPTELNVADLCTKMKKFDFSRNDSVWMTGPDFIKQSEQHWPKLPDKLLTDDCNVINNIYIKKLNYSTHELPPVTCKWANDEAIDRFRASIKATWTKTKRATARALKLHMDFFIPLVRQKQINNFKMLKEIKNMTIGLSNLTSNDYERAEHFIFRKIQREAFPEEYKALSSGNPIRNKLMKQLNVFMDPQGIIRINARTNVNNEVFPQQYAPLLPRRHAFVTSMLAYYHYKHNHIAIEAQIAEIRTIAWIPELKMALRSIKAKCNWCKIKNAMPYSPKMAPLPEDRTDTDMKAFEVTGVDILGPLRPTVNGNKKKVWILIFVCALTRYIHLHILDSMESLRILEAIAIFWTSYGPVRKFISDNGTNFKKTAKILEEDYQREKVFNRHIDILGPKLAEIYRVEWQFIPVHSPWFGGVYERLIKEVKRALSKTLESRKVNRVELNIAVMEAAHRINCRPLTENSLDAADGEILTPHHLAKNKSGWPILPGIHKNVYSTIPDRSVYRKGRALADELMRKFTSRYLPELTKQSKWHKDEPKPKVGDLVLVIEPNKTRRQWQRGKIVKIYIGKDGIARVADVRMADGKIKLNRSLRNLARLNLSKTLEEEAQNLHINVGTIFSCLTTVKNSNSVSSSIPTASSNSNSSTSSKFELVYKVQQEANFSLVDTPLKLIQSRINKFNHKTEMKRNFTRIESTTRALLIEGVSTTMPLSRVVKAIEPELHSIIGIFRQRDYAAGKDLDKVFIFLLDPNEYAKAVTNYREIVLKPGIHISFPNLTLGSAYFRQSLESADVEELKRVPMPLSLTNLPRMFSHTTMYVADLIMTFEAVTKVCGFRWCIENGRIMTRTFGFLAVPTRDDLMRLKGIDYAVNDDVVYANLSDSATILLHEVDANLINSQRKAILSDAIIRANWLNATYKEPKPTQDNLSITFYPNVQRHTAIANPIAAKSIATNTEPITDTDEAVPSSVSDTTNPIAAAVASPMITDTQAIEDTVVLTLDATEQFIEEPCCSKSIAQADKVKEPAPDDDIRDFPTARLDEGPAQKKAKKKSRSKYVTLKMIGYYPFAEFQKKCLCLTRNHEWIFFIQKDASSTAYIQFATVVDASKFKKVVEGLRREGECTISYSMEIAKMMIEKAIEKNITPSKTSESMFLMDKTKEVLQCIFNQSWGKLTFALPQFVTNSDK